MKFRSVLCSAVLTLTALAAPSPKPGTQFEIRGVDAGVTTPFVLDQRDMEQTLESLILAVNNSGIIFKTLDLLADNPTRLQAVANATGKLIEGAGSINLSFNGLDYGKLLTSLNLSGIVDAVMDSGLVTSIADGILLDKDFRPRLERLIYNAGMSLRPTLRYIFQDILGTSQKRSLAELDRDDIKLWVERRLEHPEIQQLAKRLIDKRDDASSSLFAELLGTQTANGDNTIGASELFSTLLGQNAPATTTSAGNWLDALFAAPSPTTTATVTAANVPVQQSPSTTITKTASGANWLDALFGASGSTQPTTTATNAETANNNNQGSSESPKDSSSDESTTTHTVTPTRRANSTRSTISATATASQVNWLGALFGSSNSSNATTTSVRAQPTAAVNISFGTGNSTTNFGSLGFFVTNILSGVLGSGLVENVVGDFLNALNDTGVAVYVVQEFIGNDKYINMTEDLVVDIWNTGAINLNITKLLTSVNFTEIIVVGENLLSNVDFGGMLDSLLAGNFTSLMQGLGKYASAVGDIVTDLENKGLFYELNNYVFGNSTSTSSAGKEIVSSSIKAKPTEQAAQRKASAATVLAINWSYFLTPVFVALGLMVL